MTVGARFKKRIKRHRNSTDLSQSSQLYLDSAEANNRQYKIFGAISAFSIFLLLIFYKIGLFTRTPSTYIAGSATQKFEESTNALLSAWGQAGEALKFANLPSLGQGYLTVTTMVVQQGINTLNLNTSSHTHSLRLPCTQIKWRRSRVSTYFIERHPN